MERDVNSVTKTSRAQVILRVPGELQEQEADDI